MDSSKCVEQGGVYETLSSCHQLSPAVNLGIILYSYFTVEEMKTKGREGHVAGSDLETMSA